jgi:hypothetical protein
MVHYELQSTLTWVALLSAEAEMASIIVNALTGAGGGS